MTRGPFFLSPSRQESWGPLDTSGTPSAPFSRTYALAGRPVWRTQAPGMAPARAVYGALGSFQAEIKAQPWRSWQGFRAAVDRPVCVRGDGRGCGLCCPGVSPALVPWKIGGSVANGSSLALRAPGHLHQLQNKRERGGRLPPPCTDPPVPRRPG